MERRLKIGLISITDIIPHGKNFDKALKDVLPEGTTVIMKENDIATGSLVMVLHNPEFEEVPEGQALMTVLIKLDAPEEKPKLIYNY